jgi:hypothetical protein
VYGQFTTIFGSWLEPTNVAWNGVCVLDPAAGGLVFAELPCDFDPVDFDELDPQPATESAITAVAIDNLREPGMVS